MKRPLSVRDVAESSIIRVSIEAVVDLFESRHLIFDGICEAMRLSIFLVLLACVIATFPISVPLIGWIRRSAARREIREWEERHVA